MRSMFLAGAAGCALFVTLPTVSFVGPDQEARRGVSPRDSLSASLSICRTTAAEGPMRRGLFISAAKAYAQTAIDREAPPELVKGAASSALEATVNEAARPYFEQGVGLVDGFNHFEAVRAFRAAQEADPDCALWYWGEAYALGPNINDPMDPANSPRAMEAARLASEKASTELEHALTEALLTRYSADPAADRAALDAACAGAMQQVAA